MKKVRSKAAGPVAAVLLVAALGGWHFMRTWAGAAGSGDLWLAADYGLLALVLSAILLAAGVMFFKLKWPMERCGLALVLLFGSVWMFVFAPLSGPDEIAHFTSSYGVSNVLLGETPTDQEGYVRIRREDDFLQNIYGAQGTEDHISLGRELNEETYRMIRERRMPLFVGKQEMISSVYRPVGTTPLAYLPQAMGITLARLLHFNCIALVYVGRFFNLLFFAGFTFLALRFLPFGKEILLGVLLLPMTLHLAASYSYDAFVMSLSFFFASYCLYLAFHKKKVEKKDVALLAVLIAAFGPCKMVYAVFMGFALFIPIKKFGGKKQWLLSAFAVFAAFAAAMLLVNLGTLSTYSTGSDTLVTWAGEEGFSVPLLVHNPLLCAQMVYETVYHQLDVLWLSMLGAKLGNLDPVLSLPSVLLFGMTAALAALGIRKAGEAPYFTGGQKVWILFLSAVGFLGLMIAMLLSWTPLSSRVIEGVQGRYLLPFLPFALMTLKGRSVVRTDGNDQKILFYLCAMDAYALLSLFSIVSMRL